MITSLAARAVRGISARMGISLMLSVTFAVVLLALSFGFAAGGATGSDPAVEVAVDAAVPRNFDLDSLLVSPYIARPTGQRADPINVIFVGTNDASVVANLVTNVFGWRDNDGGTMYFAQRGEVASHDRQVASATEDGKRYHIRLKSGVGTFEGQPFVLGAVHMDYNVACGHAGREFDGARNLVMMELMRRGYEVETQPWDNTEPARHCDGSQTRSDGQVAIIHFTSPIP
jgi:hypothetical protein